MMRSAFVNQSDDIEHQSGYQKHEFKNELRQLESIIGTLSSMEKSQNEKNDIRKSSGRSFGLQRLRFRRITKKRTIDKAEDTKEDIMDRVKKLQNICRDLSERLKDDGVSKTQMESRDDEIPIRRDNKDEKVAKDRTEILEALQACAKILSKFSSDPQSSHFMAHYDKYIETIEMTESKFLESSYNSEVRENLCQKVEQPVHQVQKIENKFLQSDESKTSELQANIKNSSHAVEIVSVEEDEDPTQSTCYGFNDCWLIEAIENILTYLFVSRNSGENDFDLPEDGSKQPPDDNIAEKNIRGEKDTEDTSEDMSTKEKFCGVSVSGNNKDHEQNITTEKNPRGDEGISDTTEVTTTKDYLCGVTELWNNKDDEQSPDDDIATEKDATMITVTSTVVSHSRVTPPKNPKNSIESSTRDSRSDILNPIIPIAKKLDEKGRNKITEPINEVGKDVKEKNEIHENPDHKIVHPKGVEKVVECPSNPGDFLETEIEDEISSNCDFSNSLGLAKKTNTAFESEKNLDHNDDIVTTSLDCNIFASLCVITTKEMEAESLVTRKESSPVEDLNQETEIQEKNRMDCEYITSLCSPTKAKRDLALDNEDNEDKIVEAPVPYDGSNNESEKEVGVVDMTAAHFLAAITSMNRARDCLMEAEKEPENIFRTKGYCVSAVVECVDTGLQLFDSESIEDHQIFDEEGMYIEEKDGRVIKIVTSMDFIPSIEVVGMKNNSTKEVQQLGYVEKIKNPATIETEDSRDEIDGRQITAVSTMDFIPRFEVVGFKKTDNRVSAIESSDVYEQRDESELSTSDKYTSSRDVVAKTKYFFFRGKKSGFQTRKISQKEYRRMAAKKRREQRRTTHLSKQLESSNVLRLRTIQEAPEHMEQASNDSVNIAEKIQTKFKAIQRDTPETLVKKSLKELPPPSMVHDQVLKVAAGNHHQKIVRRAPSAVQLQQGTDDSMSALTSTGFHQVALIDVATSSLTTWTPSKPYMKEVNITESEDPYDIAGDEKSRIKSLKKKSWFFQSLNDIDEEEVVQCLSTVLSIPAPSSMGTKIDYPNIEDNEYVNHYYDFGDDETVDKDNEYYEDYDKDYEYCDLYKDEEDAKDNCYVCDSY